MDDVKLKSMGPNPLFPVDGNFYRASNGFYFSDNVGGPFVREWLKNHFEAQKDDTYVVSHPKTGTTWAKEMIYVIANDLDFDKANSIRFYHRFPNMDTKIGVEQYDLTFPAPPRFMSTHFPYSYLPKSIHENKCKMIYTIRNPKDTVVSYYLFSVKNPILAYTGDFETFVDCFIKDKLWYSPYWKHVLEFWEHRFQPNILLLFYEDMKKDLPKEVKRVAAFLGKTLTEEQVKQVAEHCNFESMKNNPSVNYINDLFGNGFQFFRKGEVGDWKNILTKEMNKKLDDYSEKYFKNSGLEFTFEL